MAAAASVKSARTFPTSCSSIADASMYGRRVRIVGGALDGYEGSLLSLRGTRVRRLLVEIPNLLAAAIEVSPEYVQLL